MKLPKELVTVTTLSITVSGICFIFFVILAFYLGMQYQQLQNLSDEQLINIQSTAVTQQKPEITYSVQIETPQSSNVPNDWIWYKNEKAKIIFAIPENFSIEDLQTDFNSYPVYIRIYNDNIDIGYYNTEIGSGARPESVGTINLFGQNVIMKTFPLESPLYMDDIVISINPDTSAEKEATISLQSKSGKVNHDQIEQFRKIISTFKYIN